ncbi:MAG: SMP-30/gluconolactonase/LRE family protein, partial [Acidobacteriota bacterium]|nr:SMP-30/gluconolactonase/LRE family protein [Acidobacteriota bacterium]
MQKMEAKAFVKCTAFVILLLFAAELRAASPQRHFELQALSPRFWALVSRDAKLTKIAAGFGFTEGPVWDPHNFLYVSDEVQNKIYKVYPDGHRVTVLALGDPDGNTYDLHFRLLDCASVLRAIIRVSPDGRYVTLADRFDGMRFNSPNDVVLGPDRAIYFTDPTLDLPKGQKQEIPFQGIYRLDGHGHVQLETKELTQPNGLAFSPDGKKFYADDDGARQLNIRVFDFHGGALSNGRIFGSEQGAPGDGVPDGMRLDLRGDLFVVGPKGIWVWDADGRHLGTIVMPE